MRFFWNNLIDLSGVALTPSSEVSTLPAENVQHEFKGKYWKTGASVAAEYLVIDLGSAKAVTSVILFNHDLTSGDSLIKIQGNTADSWGAPAFSQSLTYAASVIHAAFSTQTYRYWRITFTKSSSSEQRKIGRVFLGEYFQPTDTPNYNGFSVETRDRSRRTEARSGQAWIEQQAKYDWIKVDISQFGQTDIDGIATMFDYVGQSKGLFFQCETSGALSEVYYARFGKQFNRQIGAYDGGYRWDSHLELEEQL